MSRSIQLKSGRKVALTSMIAWAQVKSSDAPKGENAKILECLRCAGPSTSRAISKLTGIERTSVTRSLNYLCRDKLIEVAYEDRCPETGKLVSFYQVAAVPKAMVADLDVKTLLTKDLIGESKEKSPCQVSGQNADYLRLKTDSIEGAQQNLFDQ